MTDSYWEDVKELFGLALEASTEERERLLGGRSTDDAVVREVRSLLAAHLDAGDRFGRPALVVLSGAGDELLQPAAASLEGKRVGAYDVGRKIGEGGMGAVYEAVRADDSYRQRVALKTVSRGADSRTIVQRFRRERQILAGLQHPHIAAMFDGGMTELGTPYFVMEFVDGLPIDDWCARHHLTIPQRLDLFRQVCSAVQHAHRRLVVHRDIKPHNILVSEDGVVKLLDFGIAKLVDSDGTDGDGTVTDGSMMPLTTAYASPEQVRGEAVSTATDVYSLGVVLYQLLTGVPPYAVAGKRPADILALVTTGQPAAPSVACTTEAARECGLDGRDRLARTLAGELDAIVLMAMRKEPERRYASADALADDLHRYLKGLPVSARPDTLGYRARKFIERQRGLVAAGVVTALAGVAFGGLALWQSRQARMEAARTERISAFLQSVLGAADVTNAGSIMRVGPHASVSALLDSAVRRVPIEFPDDPAVRARLYTSMGSSLISQSRMREAAGVLDSARHLAAVAYGSRSAALALASLEAADAALHRNRLADARRFVGEATAALEGGRLTRNELFARAFLAGSSIALVEGEYDAVDSLARRALALEDARTPRASLVKAGALNRIASMTAIHGNMVKADSIFGQALVMFDSLHAPVALERFDVVSNLAELKLGLGRVAASDSLVQTGLRQASEIFGPDSREAALFLRHGALVGLATRDTARARQQISRSLRIIDSIGEVVAPIRYLVHGTYAAYLMSLQRWEEADSVYRALVLQLPKGASGMDAIEAHLYYGYTRSMLHDLDAGESELREAEAAYKRSGVNIAYTDLLIRSNLAAIYARLGKQSDAQRYLATLSPAQQAGLKAFVAREHVADSVAMARRNGVDRTPR